MSPVRARRIPAKPFDKGLRRTRACRRLQDPAVIQPCLEVIGRGFHYYRRLEPLGFHLLETFCARVVDEAQGMEAPEPNVDMIALRVLEAEPLDFLLDLDGARPSRRIISPVSRRMASSKRSQTHGPQLHAH